MSRSIGNEFAHVVSVARKHDRLRRNLKDTGVVAVLRQRIDVALDITAIVSPQGRIDYASPSVEKVLGRAVSDLEGAPLLGLVHRADRRRVAEVFARLYKSRRTGELNESRLAENEQRFRRTISALPEGIVLRYGLLYGSGTWFEREKRGAPALHVDAAAQAAVLALTKGQRGIYNVAEDDGAVSSEKAKRELGFDAGFRIAAP